MPEISHKGLFALKKQNRFSVLKSDARSAHRADMWITLYCPQ